ncbi:MAG: YkvA family protein [Bacillota bacterium]
MNENNDIGELIKRIPKYSKMLYMLYKDREVSVKSKGILSLGIAYNISPVDLVPGIIPVAGQLDNLLVMLICIRRVLKILPQEKSDAVLVECGITKDEIDSDELLVRETLKGFGKGSVKLVSNGAKLLVNYTKLALRRMKK